MYFAREIMLQCHSYLHRPKSRAIMMGKSGDNRSCTLFIRVLDIGNAWPLELNQQQLKLKMPCKRNGSTSRPSPDPFSSAPGRIIAMGNASAGQESPCHGPLCCPNIIHGSARRIPPSSFSDITNARDGLKSLSLMMKFKFDGKLYTFVSPF